MGIHTSSPPPQGVATEYEYQHDPEDLHKQRRMDAIAAHHKACVTDKPFKPCNPAKKGEWACGEGGAHHKACVTDKPFKPCNPAKKGAWA